MKPPETTRADALAAVLLMVVAMVDKNRRRIKEDDADTFYLDRNIRWAKEELALYEAEKQARR